MKTPKVIEETFLKTMKQVWIGNTPGRTKINDIVLCIIFPLDSKYGSGKPLKKTRDLGCLKLMSCFLSWVLMKIYSHSSPSWKKRNAFSGTFSVERSFGLILINLNHEAMKCSIVKG